MAVSPTAINNADSYSQSADWIFSCFFFSVNVTVRVDTEWITNFLFPAQAHLVWPSLMEDVRRLRFAPTQVGNLSVGIHSIHIVVYLERYVSLPELSNFMRRGSEG